MKYLLFGGAPSTGKTSVVRRIALELTTRTMRRFSIVVGTISTTSDFIILLEGYDINGNKVRILVNSPSDTNKKVDELRKFYDANLPVDIIISSIRDIHTPRTYFFKKMLTVGDLCIEIPLAKVRKGKHRGLAISWYEKTIDNLAIHTLRNNPFDI